MKLPMNAFNRAIECLLRETDLRRTTVYLDDHTVVMATRRSKYNSRDNSRTILVTYGKPNYVQRKFIKDCKRAGEPLPVRKVQFKYWPKKG